MKRIIFAIKCLFIGACILIPGAGPATMLVVVGSYSDIVFAMQGGKRCNNQDDKRNNYLHVLAFAIFTGVGAWLFSAWFLSVYFRFEIVALYALLGMLFGGSVSMFIKSGMRRIGFMDAVWVLAGFWCISSGVLTPMWLGNMMIGPQGFWGGLPVGAIVTFLSALPGFSGIRVMLQMGVYDFVIRALTMPDTGTAIMLVFGGVVGIWCAIRVISALMIRFDRTVYMVFSGMVLGSALEMQVRLPNGANMWICIAAMIAGGVIAVVCGRGR